MADVFISYKREERDKARVIAEAIAAEGYSVWWDVELLSGETFGAELEAIIRKAKASIVLWSTLSIQSHWVKEEAELARKLGTLVPVLLDEADPPFGYQQINAENLRSWDGSLNAPELTRLLRAVRQKAGPAPDQSPRSASEVETAVNAFHYEATYWASISQSSVQRISEYEAYLERFGADAQFADLARSRISTLKRKPVFGTLSKWGGGLLGTAAAIATIWVAVYPPGGSQAPNPVAGPEATQAVTNPVPATTLVSDNQAELQAWRLAQQTDTIAAYRAYLEDYSDGENVSAANSRIRALELEAAAKAERSAWGRAQSADTLAAYQTFLRDYPSGANASAARTRITALSTPPEPSYRPGQVFRDALQGGGGEGPEMVVIPSGRFSMGSPAGEADRNEDEDDTAGAGGRQRTVTIGYEFAVGKYEVTWAEWEACVADGGCGGHRPSDAGWGKGSRPVINVSWEDARAYACWLNDKLADRAPRGLQACARDLGGPYRLPTEAEWEYACRAGTDTPFYFGETITPDQANYDGKYTYGDGPKGTYHEMTMPVGSYPRNAFGLHDMHGNVWERVEDCYEDSYTGASTDGSARIVGKCSRRVLRGGSWDNVPQILRSANRIRDDSSERYNDLGFRVARTL